MDPSSQAANEGERVLVLTSTPSSDPFPSNTPNELAFLEGAGTAGPSGAPS